MDNRLKIGLRPRPNIGRAGAVPEQVGPRPVAPPPGRPSVMQAPVLVLNATFEPINVTAVRRALVLVLKGVAQAEETNHAEVHSASRAIQVPSVIRLVSYRHIPQQSRALSRKNILLRDRNTCQFCGDALFETLRNEMFQPFGLVMDLFDGIVQDLIEKCLQQAVMAQDLQRSSLACC